MFQRFFRRRRLFKKGKTNKDTFILASAKLRDDTHRFPVPTGSEVLVMKRHPKRPLYGVRWGRALGWMLMADVDLVRPAEAASVPEGDTVSEE